MVPELDESWAGKHAAAELENGDLLIYDTLRDDAWLRSDVTRSLSVLR